MKRKGGYLVEEDFPRLSIGWDPNDGASFWIRYLINLLLIIGITYYATKHILKRGLKYGMTVTEEFAYVLSMSVVGYIILTFLASPSIFPFLTAFVAFIITTSVAVYT